MCYGCMSDRGWEAIIEWGIVMACFPTSNKRSACVYVWGCLLFVVYCPFDDEDRLVEDGWRDILSSGNKNMYALRIGD